MATIKAVKAGVKASLGNVIKYIMRDDKTNDSLMYGKDCDVYCAINQMKMTKAMYDKEDGRQYYHFVQSFSKDENITHKQAFEIAKELAEKRFQGFEVVMATHTDTEHIHTHFVVNSVNFENGYKLHWNKSELQHMKNISDDICRKNGLSVIDKKNNKLKETTYHRNKYKILQKDKKGECKSYVKDCYTAVNKACLIARSKDEFINKMNDTGWSVVWQDNRKYITFENKNGNKVRNRNLSNTFGIDLSKESLLNKFEENDMLNTSKEFEQAIVDEKISTNIDYTEIGQLFKNSSKILSDDNSSSRNSTTINNDVSISFKDLNEMGRKQRLREIKGKTWQR